MANDDDTKEFARALTASASAGRKDAMPLNKEFINALVTEIAKGHAPVIANYVRLEIIKALQPLEHAISEIESELRERR